MLTLILASFLLFNTMLLRATDIQIPYTVKDGQLMDTVYLSGTIAPLNSETVRAEWYSLVRKINVELGQRVKKGDLLAEVELKYLESRLAYLRTRIKFLEGQVDQAQRDENYVNADHNRLRKLAAQEIVARSEVENNEVKVLDTRIGRIRADKELKDTKEKLSQTEDQIRQANYYAPVDGVVTYLVVNPKQLLGAFVAEKGTKLIRIDESEKYVVKCLALDTHVIHMKPDTLARVTLEGSGEFFEGNISQIIRSEELGEDGFNLFEVSIVFNRPGPILNRDLLARVEIPIGFPEKGPILPWNAITVNSKGNFVQVRSPDQSWVPRQVQLGVRGPHQVLVRSGLKAGEVVLAALW